MSPALPSVDASPFLLEWTYSDLPDMAGAAEIEAPRRQWMAKRQGGKSGGSTTRWTLPLECVAREVAAWLDAQGELSTVPDAIMSELSCACGVGSEQVRAVWTVDDRPGAAILPRTMLVSIGREIHASHDQVGCDMSRRDDDVLLVCAVADPRVAVEPTLRVGVGDSIEVRASYSSSLHELRARADHAGRWFTCDRVLDAMAREVVFTCPVDPALPAVDVVIEGRRPSVAAMEVLGRMRVTAAEQLPLTLRRNQLETRPGDTPTALLERGIASSRSAAALPALRRDEGQQDVLLRTVPLLHDDALTSDDHSMLHRGIETGHMLADPHETSWFIHREYRTSRAVEAVAAFLADRMVAAKLSDPLYDRVVFDARVVEDNTTVSLGLYGAPRDRRELADGITVQIASQRTTLGLATRRLSDSDMRGMWSTANRATRINGDPDRAQHLIGERLRHRSSGSIWHAHREVVIDPHAIIAPGYLLRDPNVSVGVSASTWHPPSAGWPHQVAYFAWRIR